MKREKPDNDKAAALFRTPFYTLFTCKKKKRFIINSNNASNKESFYEICKFGVFIGAVCG